MPQRIILIGADEAALAGVFQYIQSNSNCEAVALYPDQNPLPEFLCCTMERYLGRGIDFPERLRACAIDRANKQVLVRDTISGSESCIKYDKLVFASGAASADLDVHGEHLSGILRINGFEDTTKLRPIAGRTVVIGNSAKVFMVVSALLGRDSGPIEVILHNVQPNGEPLSESLSTMVHHHLEGLGVTIRTNDKLCGIKKSESGFIVATDKGSIESGRIINAMDSQSISYMAVSADIATDMHGNIIVDEQLRTNDPDIFACGTCAAFKNSRCKHPIPGTSIRLTEARQSDVLALSLAEHEAIFSAPAPAYSIPLNGLTMASAGLTLKKAKQCGFNPLSATVIQFERAHFMPDANLITLELVFDATTRQVLGIQGLGASGDALCGRISPVSAMLTHKPTIEDIANLEIAYSPPFASALDVINTVANVAENILAGVNEGISATEFDLLWQERENGQCFFLDCREIGNAESFVERHPFHWNHIPQGEIARRIKEIPEDRKIILLCNTGARSYEAQVTLKHAGMHNVANVDGGIAAINQSGIKV